jgi:hypothetical protein
MPLGLLLSSKAMPTLAKIALVVLGSAIAGYLIVAILFGLVGAHNIDLLGLFGAFPAAVTAAIWCVLNTDFLGTSQPGRKAA